MTEGLVLHTQINIWSTCNGFFSKVPEIWNKTRNSSVP